MGEIPVSYKERLGESKLSMLKDGWRFLLIAFQEDRLRRRKKAARPVPVMAGSADASPESGGVAAADLRIQ
jgi:hypothetical protein